MCIFLWSGEREVVKELFTGWRITFKIERKVDGKREFGSEIQTFVCEILCIFSNKSYNSGLNSKVITKY